MGGHDTVGSRLRGCDRAYGRCDKWSAGQRGGSGFLVYYHGGRGGTVDGTHGDCPEGGAGQEAYKRDRTVFEVYVSENS